MHWHYCRADGQNCPTSGYSKIASLQMNVCGLSSGYSVLIKRYFTGWALL